MKLTSLIALVTVIAGGIVRGDIALANAAILAAAELPDLVAKVLPGVVNVSSSTISQVRGAFGRQGPDDFFQFWGIPQERKQTSLGSGFILDSDGYVYTNSHVVEGADEVMVTLHDKRTFRAKLIGMDQKLDIALLQIRDGAKKTPSGLVGLPLGNSEAVRIAEAVFAVGNPFGLQHTVTMGIISAKNRTIGLGPLDNFLQTDAAINPGNSGGPLFNLKGEVIGINTVIYSRTGQSGGLGFAIPANEAKAILADLKRYGRVPRPWLGILGERVTPALAEHYSLTLEKGVVVYNLVQGGPADKAGLRLGDIITSIAGATADEPSDVERALFKLRPTESVPIKIRRGPRDRQIEVPLAELPRLDRLPPGII